MLKAQREIGWYNRITAITVGCGSVGTPNEPYSCHMSSPCNGGFERVLYGWGKNAPPMSLPDGVGYSVGPGSAIEGLVLQVNHQILTPFQIPPPHPTEPLATAIIACLQQTVLWAPVNLVSVTAYAAAAAANSTYCLSL